MSPLLLTLYPLGWKEKHFHLETLKLVPRLQSFYLVLSSRVVTPPHTLSSRLKRKTCSFTPHPLGWKEKHNHLATLKLVPRWQIFCLILSHVAPPSHTLSHRLKRKTFSFGNFKISSQAPEFLSHLITRCLSFSHLIP